MFRDHRYVTSHIKPYKMCYIGGFIRKSIDIIYKRYREKILTFLLVQQLQLLNLYQTTNNKIRLIV